jgi:hypothetical protein
VKKLIALLLVAALIVTTGIGCGGSTPTKPKTEPTTPKAP